MTEFLTSYPQPPDDDRRRMEPEMAQAINLALERGEPLCDFDRLSLLTAELTKTDTLDGWRIVNAFTETLHGSYDLYWGDLGLLRPCLGNEHAAAVFDGNEIDYAPLFYQHSQALLISRLTAVLQDSGKVLSVAEEGNNFNQSWYNERIARNVFNNMGQRHLSNDGKKATVMLVRQDIIGGLLQDKPDASEKLARFRAEWPEALGEYRDDLLLTSYLSDASAHSSYRFYRNARNGYIEPAVRPDDMQLTFLFERHPDGALTLTPDRCQKLLEFLSNVNLTRHLLTGELGPYAREDSVFASVIARKLGTSALDSDGVLRFIEPNEDNDSQDVIEFHRSDALGLVFRRITSGTPPEESFASYMHRDRVYHLAGDGRLWERTRLIQTIFDPAKMPIALQPASLQALHQDPEIAEMQRRMFIAQHGQENVIGHPLPASKAWKVVNDAESVV